MKVCYEEGFATHGGANRAPVCLGLPSGHVVIATYNPDNRRVSKLT